MPIKFTKMFADKLNDISKVEVKEAVDGDRIITGRVLIAPGGKQMEVVRSGGRYIVRCKDGEKVNGHIPSVEVLFDSVAQYVGGNAVGVILTGMGRDGADAMVKMRQAGARTLAQDERTSVVWGMPKEAYQNGGAERLVGIEEMTQSVVQLLKEMR
jgi:two-component system chemotaxis response regulator CheB